MHPRCERHPGGAFFLLGFSGNWRSNSSSISFFIALWSLSILASTCFSPACSGGGQAHKGAEEGEKSRPGRHDARRRVGGRECEGSCMETGETGERLAEGIGLCFIPAFIDLFIHADRLVQGPSRLLRVRAFTCCSVPGCREQPCASALRASCTADANASPSAVRIHDVPRPRGPLAVPLSYIRHAQPQPCWDRAGGREGTQTAWMCLAPGFAAAGLHALACQSSSSPSAARTASGTALASFARPPSVSPLLPSGPSLTGSARTCIRTSARESGEWVWAKVWARRRPSAGWRRSHSRWMPAASARPPSPQSR